MPHPPTHPGDLPAWRRHEVALALAYEVQPRRLRPSEGPGSADYFAVANDFRDKVTRFRDYDRTTEVPVPVESLPLFFTLATGKDPASRLVR